MVAPSSTRLRSNKLAARASSSRRLRRIQRFRSSAVAAHAKRQSSETRAQQQERRRLRSRGRRRCFVKSSCVPSFALGVDLPPQTFALGIQEQNQSQLKFRFAENILLMLHGLRTPGNDCAEFAVGEGARSMYRGWINS
jgi:hypothetical protein